MLSSTVAQKIVSSLYEGVLDPGSWFEGMEILTTALDSCLFHNAGIDKLSGQVSGGISNSARPIEKVREHEMHYAHMDPRSQIYMGLPIGQFCFDHDCFSDREMSRMPIYTDWLASVDLRYSLLMPLQENEQSREVLVVLRESNQESFGQESRSLLAHLLPDLCRAAKLRARVSDLAVLVSQHSAALDALPQAVALLAADARLAYLNAAARKFLAHSQSLHVQNGKLTAKGSLQQTQLSKAVASACASRSSRAESLLVPPSAKGKAFVLHVMPLLPSHPLAVLHKGQPYALLSWSVEPQVDFVTRLSEQLRITITEAELAICLSQGRTVKEFALEHGCSWHTARTHLKNLMLKTGTHRQAELVQLVSMLCMM